ncbi:HTH-type transcriptional regulator cueR [Vibrio nigripulchritudo SFn27]|uniref:HTH-type transcriptional regulator CueR n=1 Tax=Vibrio nigripulchritudo TaxID=28173 RepID=U4KDS1_9VIBR|nr:MULTISPECIES: Cu(I)-responsive transcriptional regulator [Vibrio]UAB69566.1 Cu(I)-responsive transcriptional regulator [Vibrio sp. SCSIO 43132]CCN85102.1 HTH-type transcriptional regulator cueR [Vibrio nigripulchritudo BLFn1]CCN90314.1 HTH-type transcriptional regulator cueR [Vibrio nigripulchritudo SFn27]CCN94073.1 HTH-type transcriptional regulator cueR [Vibrio nigripulchritudo ENn2]CCO42426.1 HTH-type transcriptional regulator cueR [Vibrio nigripulchritudo SFn135]
MNISKVAELTGLTAKSIRFYESKEITSPALRSANGYRTYSEKHIEELQLVARARAAGFNLDECKSLLELAFNPSRTSAEVKQKTREKLAEVEAKISELTLMKSQLEAWIEECPGDEGQECPIIDNLCGHKK